MALLGVLQLHLGQAVGREERVAHLLPQGTGFRDGGVRRRVGRPGVVYLGSHYSSGGGA